MNRILIIAPHADDEILGCYGYMAQEIRKGSIVHVLFGTIGGVDKKQDRESRIKEVEVVSKKVGYSWSVITYDKDAEMDVVPNRFITTEIDNLIDSFKPNIVLVNYPSSHQDHKKIYECAMASMRLKESHMPSLFALYEYPFIRGTERPNGGCMYLDISEYIEEKCKIFSLYKSQVKKAPSPLNEDGIKTLSRMRGLESGLKYAEVFYIQKIIVQ